MKSRVARVLMGCALLAGSLRIQAASCDEPASFALPDATITFVESIEPPVSKTRAPELPYSSITVPFCRVAAVLKPTQDSAIGIEVWLPAPSSWNGKFLGVGNGGLGGRISYEAMLPRVAGGYAVVANDTGHDNSLPLGAFALGHPEKVVDFGYRATHVAAVSGKAITEKYYGRAPARAYFSGCSRGGGEAMMEAQRFPEDYDGIVAGSPVINWTAHEAGGHLWSTLALYASPGSAISAEKASLIGRAVNDACDARDGVKDGVLQDPRACHFDPGRLQCKGEDSAECLTAAQVAAVRKLWEGPAKVLGRGYYPGLERGGEAVTWRSWIAAPSAETNAHGVLGVPYFKYFVYGDRDWDFRKADLVAAAARSDRELAATLNAVNPDLSAFQQRGGKLIHYHGFSDPDIPPRSSIQYYDSVVRRMGGRKQVDPFYRLFMVPGMGHCGGGPGATSFDMLSALEQWREQGTTPEQILATRYVSNDATKGAAFTRPLCPYPQIARYKGSESPDEAASFQCVRPGAHEPNYR